ncbi:uncharacterized protein LOC144880373 [Branchiostoma floridae x Branchiostoma japonicum]
MAQRKRRQNVTAASGHPKHRHDNSSQAKDDTVDPSVFYTCPWLSSQTPYLLYRLLMAGGVLYYIWCDVLYMGVGFLLWLSLASNWSVTLLVVHFTWGAALCAAHRPVQKIQNAARKSQHSPRQQPSKLPWHLRAYRPLSIMTYTASFVTSIGYAALLSHIYGWDLHAILTHVVNSVIVIVDILLSRVPIRLNDYVYIAGLNIAYLTSTLVYWAVGQMTGSENIAYWFLDYTKAPGQALVVSRAWYMC